MSCIIFGMAAAFIACGVAYADDEAIPPVVGGATYARHLAAVERASIPGVRAIAISTETNGVSKLIGASPVTPVKGGDVVRAPLKNVSGDVLGVIAITFAPGATEKAAAADKIAAYVSHRLLSVKNLADPYPYDATRSAHTYAQRLVDETMRAHPELLVFAIHATPPGEKTNIIIGSNIGRIGKHADEDDTRVIDKGTTNLEIPEGVRRFEVELPLNDAVGHRIGALGEVFAFTPGVDKEASHAHAIVIRDELARRIPANAALFAIAK